MLITPLASLGTRPRVWLRDYWLAARGVRKPLGRSLGTRLKSTHVEVVVLGKSLGTQQCTNVPEYDAREGMGVSIMY